MGNYYTTLGVAPDASREEVEAAYARQVERYNPAMAAAVDAELQKVAEQRVRELEHIRSILSDPQRRRQYDVSIGLAPKPPAQVGERRSLTPRERLYGVVGAVAALALVATIWVLTGRNQTEQARAMGEVNRPAPAIELPALGGGAVSLADYRGQVVVLNFWGTWCEPCRRELPALQQAHTTYGDEGLAVIGVNLTDDEPTQGVATVEEIRTFLDQYGVTYPIALDVEGQVTNAYRVFPLPTSFFIDAQGQIRYVHVGELTLDDVRLRFAELRQAASVPGAN